MAVTVDSFASLEKYLIPTLRHIEEILAIIGLLYVGKVAIATLCDIGVGLYAHVYSKLRSKKFETRYGKWAGKYEIRNINSIGFL